MMKRSVRFESFGRNTGFIKKRFGLTSLITVSQLTSFPLFPLFPLFQLTSLRTVRFENSQNRHHSDNNGISSTASIVILHHESLTRHV